MGTAPRPLSPSTLDPVVRAHLGPGAVCRSAVRGPVGNGQETWFLEVSLDGQVRQLVLRRSQPGGPLAWTDRGREFAVLQTLADRGLPVPAVHWVDDSDALELPYLVMDRAPGVPATTMRGADADGVWRDLGRWLARLHAADLGEGTAEQGTAAELDRWQAAWRRDSPGPLPLLDGLLAWLRRSQPRSSRRAVLLWGDPGPHNALAADGRITALLDWELAHHGDPLDDLGAAVWFAGSVGVDPAALLTAYEQESGEVVDREALRWFTALACVTRSTMIASGARSFVRGDISTPSIAGLALDLPASQLARAAQLAGWGEVAVPALPDPEPVPPHGLQPDTAATARGIADFLAEQVLEAVDDRQTRRGVKTAVALLRVSALRAAHGPGLDRVRADRDRVLLTDLGAAGVRADDGLAAVAARVEQDDSLAQWRDRVRRHLLTDLALQRSLLTPLRDLYGSR